ncbi:PREDICTED: interleukin-15 receptor subunit alpha isoform X1 [Rhinopithecus bieti]|uniref:interleukin-15 receptor subunit alpha isoform X1 n=1 Tax=Rhinopithecus bieti TaxID=61621 RepID=UPI00083BF37F|nr:PREDICTED: interleukin-15 receptor subunit alpha isoform X1 [Rhinopithecus bieti]
MALPTLSAVGTPDRVHTGGPGARGARRTGRFSGLRITCPPPVSVEHADIRVKSYSLYSRERYICNSGFKRKAGTSSLTECVLNKATNIAHWTTPSLKCIRDPLLARQRPAPPFTVTTAGVTPQPESLSSSGKEPTASSPSSNTTAATTAAIVPSSRLVPSTSPSTGTTEIGSHESSHGPSQTTAKTWELTASASHQPPGVYPQGHSDTTVAISTSTVLLCGLSAVSLLACYIKSRVSLCHPGWSTVSCKVTTARSLNLELQQSSCLGWIQCWGYRREPLLPAKVSFLMPQFPPKTSRLILCFLCHVNGDSAVGKSKLEKEKAQNNSADAVITQRYASAMVPV